MKLFILCILILLIPLTVTAKPYHAPQAVLVANTVDAEIVTLPAPQVETPKPTPQYDGSIPNLIRRYAAEYGANADLALRIAKCESGFNPLAKNTSSTASGVYQYLASTWRNTPEGKAGISVFDAEANVRAGVRAIAKSTSPWNASKACWAR